MLMDFVTKLTKFGGQTKEENERGGFFLLTTFIVGLKFTS